MEEEHRHLAKPKYGFLRHLNHTQPREEEEEQSIHQQRSLSCCYGLRENPKKKTQKSPESMKKTLLRCGECGKGFRYEKCLSNHQAGMHLSTTKQRVYEESIKSLCSSFSLVTKKKRSPVTRYKKTPSSCSFTRFLESPPSVYAENDEELEVAECLILLSKSSPKLVADGMKLVGEAMDAATPERSRDGLSNKKPRKACEFESGFFSNEEEGFSSYETSTELASFLGEIKKLRQQKWRRVGEFESEFASKEQKLLKEGVFTDGCELEQRYLRESGAMEECYDSETEMVRESDAKSDEHQCRLCKKIFSSYQALGGHQTLHRMSKCKRKKDCSEEPGEDESVTVKNEKKRYKCSICSKLFRSAHALGGHKKCHGKREKLKTDDDDREDLGIVSVVPVTAGVEFY
ncbi:unnamed protein product [Microthlaspi erraticum]|uniref:C2H2-type domain-containing protein n=1 Tax=Microthlaspi erraticum TaxID=1685480 RepID=A0A6D2J1B9_9BRAS|nr:unnamed protein product [Microthlaspi erraticum]